MPATQPEPMFSFFKKKPPAPAVSADPVPIATTQAPAAPVHATTAEVLETPASAPPEAGRVGWMERLRQGLRKTSTGITQVFTGVRIDETLYEELESALLLADTGLPATEY